MKAVRSVELAGLLLMLANLLQACGGPLKYRPYGCEICTLSAFGNYYSGYETTLTGRDQFRVTYSVLRDRAVGSEVTHKSVLIYAIYRCAEIAIEQDKKHFVFTVLSDPRFANTRFDPNLLDEEDKSTLHTEVLQIKVFAVRREAQSAAKGGMHPFAYDADVVKKQLRPFLKFASEQGL